MVLVLASEICSAATSSIRMPSIYTKYVELYCYKSSMWFLIPLSYNICIMIICAWIGFFTRKLPDNFNESWFIFILVATTLFSWVVLIPAYFTVANAYLQSAILGFALILIGLVTLVCQYLPVLYALAFVPPENVVTAQTISERVASPVNEIGPSSEC